MLRMKIGKAAYDKLPADIQKEYKADGDDYTLDTDGEDAEALRNARDDEKRQRQEAARDRDKFKRDLEVANNKIKDLEKDGSVDDKVAAKERELTEKHTTDMNTANATIESMRTALIEGEKSRVASTMANKISTSPLLLTPEIAKRLHVELDAQHKPVTKIVGTDGKVSAGTLEDLEKSILTNKDYAPVLIGSKGSGGGRSTPIPPSGGGSTRGNPPSSGTGQPAPSLATMDPKDLAARIREGREQAGSV